MLGRRLAVVPFSRHLRQGQQINLALISGKERLLDTGNLDDAYFLENYSLAAINVVHEIEVFDVLDLLSVILDVKFAFLGTIISSMQICEEKYVETIWYSLSVEFSSIPTYFGLISQKSSPSVLTMTKLLGSLGFVTIFL